jgi:hypothetical protein
MEELSGQIIEVTSEGSIGVFLLAIFSIMLGLILVG